MKREIKFRVWDIDTKHMYFPDKDCYMDKLIETESWKPMQFIGIDDRDGIDIYEGDIVRTNYQNFPQGVVEFYQGMYVYRDKSVIQPIADLVINKWRLYVIGNIYENPELLNN